MAHFIADIQGNRGPASRLGSKDSGISAHARGWNVGAEVVVRHLDGRDVVFVYATSGSNNRKGRTLIAEFTAEDLED